MRLITHNMLQCNKKNVEKGYPLKITADEIEVIESEYQDVFLKKMIPKLNWPAFVEAATTLHAGDKLPKEIDESMFEDEELMKAIHHALVEIHVKKGKLTCPESGREFPISDGIPNMLLREDEV